MDSQVKHEKIVVKPSFQLFIYYLIATSAAYHLGFWYQFKIDVFQFMSLGDIPRLAIWPVLAFFVFFMIGTLLSPVLIAEKEIDERLSKNLANYPDRWYAIFKSAPYLWVIVCIYLSGIIAMAINNDPNFWAAASMLVGVFFAVYAERRMVISLSKAATKNSLVYIMVMVPIIAIGNGITNSTKIIMGSEYRRALLTSATRAAAGLKDGQELRFLAETASDVILMVDSGPSVLVLPRDRVDSMILIPIKNKRIW